MGDHLLGVEVDGHVVAEVEQAGEAKAWEIFAPDARPRPGEQGELGVGGAQHHDVAGALAEVDGLAAVGDSPGLGGKQVHPVLSLSAAAR